MPTRSHAYYSANRLKIHLEDADHLMYFRIIDDLDGLPRNMRSERSVAYSDDIADLPDDMILVVYHSAEGVLLFLEKWKLAYIDAVNIVNDGKRSAKIYVPYKHFKSIGGGHDWIDTHATNVTWDTIKHLIAAEKKPDNFNDQLPHFQDAIRRAKQGQ